MKINNSRRRKPRKTLAIVITVVIIALLGAGTAFAYYHFVAKKSTSDTTLTTQPSGIVNYSTPTTAQQQAGSAAKSSASSQNTATDDSLKITLQGGTPKLTALLNIITNTGTCTLNLTGPSAITKTSDIQAESSYSVCEGFDTSTLESGIWDATVSVQSGSQTGSASEMFTVK